jgi:glycine cleavage system aminomethyltransferase T
MHLKVPDYISVIEKEIEPIKTEKRLAVSNSQFEKAAQLRDLEKQKMEGVTRKLVGFEMVDRGIPRHGYELVNAEGEQVGVVTSGTMSPTRKIGIGMGYVKPEYSKVGTEICIDMRGRKLKAVVVKPPFRK